MREASSPRVTCVMLEAMKYMCLLTLGMSYNITKFARASTLDAKWLGINYL